MSYLIGGIIAISIFIVGMIVGREKECDRIQNIFRIKEKYTYNQFYSILEEFEVDKITIKRRMEKYNKKG